MLLIEGSGVSMTTFVIARIIGLAHFAVEKDLSPVHAHIITIPAHDDPPRHVAELLVHPHRKLHLIAVITVHPGSQRIEQGFGLGIGIGRTAGQRSGQQQAKESV